MMTFLPLRIKKYILRIFVCVILNARVDADTSSNMVGKSVEVRGCFSHKTLNIFYYYYFEAKL